MLGGPRSSRFFGSYGRGREAWTPRRCWIHWTSRTPWGDGETSYLETSYLQFHDLWKFCPFRCCRELQEAEVFQALMGFRVQRWALIPVKHLNGTMMVLIGMKVSSISCFWTGHSGRTRTARVNWHQRVSWRPGTWWRARPDGSSGKNRISGFSSFSLEIFLWKLSVKTENQS